MTKTKNDEIYEAGIKDGKSGTLLDDFVHNNFVKGSGFTEEARKEQEIFDKGRDFGVDHRYDASNSSNSSSEESDSGGCYLTTACMSASGLQDNCLELNVLRNFRDRILLQTPRGRKAVKEYYQIAPEIVQSIDEKDSSLEIWNSVYQDVRKAVQLVLSGDFNQAFKHYREMTLRLRNFS